ncbi:hypothetical protein N5K21_25425 [Rhizobium pusense]|uniref:Uncharacterized protein n=1 Tax=Agrobacterium pusense TaxID=648995 RepID=A0A6H0ZP38_9HYPH|nr:hypothetical protein [Agrobacterium pusense]MDH2092072.1 hypothetical protein [Agrobacterium pusense]QIX22612.1 hypothetical protein FOB41_16405 [Agrobacterium pusense]WCK24524.1 hypothetical protein CFBP5496_0002705 [Agrobacterium pusense]
MTENTCAIPTPEQRKYLEIREAAAEVADGLAKAGLEFEPTSRDYFAFATQQVLFVRLCGGDPETLKGGDAEIGQRIVNNGQHIIDHYWRRADDG